MLTPEQDARLHELAILDRTLTEAELDEVLGLMDDLRSDYRRIETVRVVGDVL